MAISGGIEGFSNSRRCRSTAAISTRPRRERMTIANDTVEDFGPESARLLSSIGRLTLAQSAVGRPSLHRPASVCQCDQPGSRSWLDGGGVADAGRWPAMAVRSRLWLDLHRHAGASGLHTLRQGIEVADVEPIGLFRYRVHIDIAELVNANVCSRHVEVR